MRYSSNNPFSHPSQRPYNPADYHPPYIPSKRPHTSNSWTVRIWLAVAFLATPFYTYLWPTFVSKTPPHLIPFTLLLIGSWIGLASCTASSLFKNPLLKACRRKYNNSPNGLLKGDLLALRIAFPIQGLWAIASLALYGWILYALDPIPKATHAYETYFGASDNPLLYGLLCAIEIFCSGIIYSPLLAGNLLGALPKDPMPEENPYLPPLHPHSIRADSPWEGHSTKKFGQPNKFGPNPKIPLPTKGPSQTWNNKKPTGLDHLLEISKKIARDSKNRGKE